MSGLDFARESDEAKVARLRELIPATSAGIYLDTAYRGPLPAETAAAMRDADDWELRVGRATEGREDDFAQRRAEARAVIAALIGADPNDIRLALTLPTTIAQNWRALDATLLAGAIPLDVASLDADFVIVPGDRWLLGPEATGAIWVGPRPRAAGVQVPESQFARTQVLGLARSVGWLEMYVGLPWIYERGRALAARLRETLMTITTLEMQAPDTAATVVCFRLESWPTEDLLTQLRRRAYAIVGATPDGRSVRSSVAWFNTEGELDRFVSAVAEIAQYTPETLPRKKTLDVL